MDLFKRRLRMGGSILLPLIFSSPLFADVPVVDLMAKPVKQSSGYVAKPQSVEQRLQILERKIGNDALIDLYQRLDALQVEVQQLRGLQEEQGHSLEGVKQRQRSLYVDLDQRINNLQKELKQLSVPVPAVAGSPLSQSIVDNNASGHGEGGGLAANGSAVANSGEGVAIGSTGVGVVVPVAPTTDGVVTANGAVATTTPPAPVNPLQEQSDYQKALDLLMAGSYEEAIAAFSSFLQYYPNGEYQMNAQYWLGEAYYVSRYFDQAIEAFSQVIADKTARKRPDAMLKSGYSFYEQKRWPECRELLQQLIADYPQSTAAGLAEQRLQMLRAANL
ncbi:TPR repeat containing exported protein; Putative periplasmic protein contains a protein prenylyltransferase domain [hydrothermal vent metagenome]|uniref:TPR repeat containing exported protein Putative periplasmic protein contains a protein prenylyltransferase domain n=1 Tax=hydrothermal vent metagenome TaxID=652676 RepID=A0A3B0ZLI6_9ZZZZ